jgi:antitoxin component HigA of HigAB toxin-antitoxin module
LFDAALGTPECDKLNRLVDEVVAYEDINYPIPLPRPVEVWKYFIESRGITL